MRNPALLSFRADYSQMVEEEIGDFYPKVADDTLTVNALGEACYGEMTVQSVKDKDATAFWDRVAELQRLFSSARFHVFGFFISTEKQYIFLSTEFAQPLRNKYFWRRVASFASRTKGKIVQMDRYTHTGEMEKHVEVLWRIWNGCDTKTLLDRLIPESADIWYEGGMAVS